MKLLICLAMSCGLTAILYFYLKQKILTIEARLNTLTDLAQTLATEVYHFQKEKGNHLENVEPLVNDLTGGDMSSDSDSSGSDSDCETDSETDSGESENEMQLEMKTVKLEDFPVKLEDIKPVKFGSSLNEIVIDISEQVEKRELDPIVVSDDEVDIKHEVQEITEITEVKQIDVSTNYSNLTLKELKQQVIDLGGPPLKTKQALINFLKKKV